MFGKEAGMKNAAANVRINLIDGLGISFLHFCGSRVNLVIYMLSSGHRNICGKDADN